MSSSPPIGSAVSTIDVGANPTAAVFDPSNGYLYVTNGTSPTGHGNITAINSSTNQIVDSIKVGVYPMQVAYDSANGDLYVANADSSYVSVVNTTSQSVVANVSLGGGESPDGISYDSWNGYLYVSNVGAGKITLIDGATNKNVGAITVGTLALGSAFDASNGCIYVTGPNSDNVTVINGSTNRTVASINVGSAPHAVSFDSANGDLYVANAGSDNVSVVNGSSNAVVDSVSVGNGPLGVVYDNSSGLVYVSNVLSDNLTVIDGASDLVVGSVTMGSGTVETAYDWSNRDLYSATDQNVTLIDVGPTNETLVARPASLDVNQTTLLESTVASGNGPNSYSYVGLPAGCFSANSSSLVCTPHATGHFTVTSTVSDRYGLQTRATASLVVGPPPKIETFTATPGSIDLGQSTNFSVSLASAGENYSFSYTGLPAGCSSANVSSLPCRPAKAGGYEVFVEALDGVGGNDTAFTSLVVEPDLAITSFSAQPSAVDVQHLVDFSVDTSGGTGGESVIYSGLPPGCSQSASANLSCRPDAAGVYSIGVAITDSAGLRAVDAITLTVNPLPTLVAVDSSRHSLDVGQSVDLNVSVSDGTPPYSFTYSGLPLGCAVADSPDLTCVPAAAGVTELEVEVVDADSAAVNGTASLVVNSDPMISGFNASPASISLGQNVTFIVTALGGTGSFAYDYGNLPAGCDSANSSRLNCTPTSAGTYTVEVGIQDSAGERALGATTLIVLATPQSKAAGPWTDYFLGGGFAVVAAVVAVIAIRRWRLKRSG